MGAESSCHTYLLLPSPMPGRGIVTALWAAASGTVRLRQDSWARGRGWLMRWLATRAYEMACAVHEPRRDG